MRHEDDHRKARVRNRPRLFGVCAESVRGELDAQSGEEQLHRHDDGDRRRRERRHQVRQAGIHLHGEIDGTKTGTPAGAMVAIQKQADGSYHETDGATEKN